MEATSSSDYDSSSPHPPLNSHPQEVPSSLDSSSRSEVDSESENSSDNTVDETRQAALRKHSNDDTGSSSYSQSSSSSENDDESQEEEVESSLPLAERLKHARQMQGVDLRQRRENKSKARLIASARLKLHRHKKVEKQQTKHPNDDTTASASKALIEPDKKKKKKSRHRPTEASSKRQDFYAHRPDLNERGIGVELNAHKYQPRDPRASSLSGHLNESLMEHNYQFLDDLRTKEIATLRQRIRARQTKGKKGQRQRRKIQLDISLEDDQAELKRLVQEQASVERARVERASKRAVSKQLQEEAAQGKRFFVKRQDRKRLLAQAKFDELKKRGGTKAVDQAMAKRRKKNKSRDAGLAMG